MHASRILLAMVLLIASAKPAPAGQQPEPDDPKVVCSMRLRELVQACIVYEQKHGGYPPDLAAAAPFLGDGEGNTALSRDLIQNRFVSTADPGLRVPPDAGSEWINTKSSYVYLGRAGISWQDVPEWGSTVVAHLRLDRPHPTEPTPQNPEGHGYMLAFADNHVEFVISRDQAERAIAESKQTWEALATGAPFPERIQALWNLGRIARALRAYAAAHDGVLPPTLGDALPFVPPDPKRAATPKQRAQLFLSARAQKNTFVPEDPTPEWVNRNTSYVYLGTLTTPGELRLPRIADADRTVLIHARPADLIVVPGGGDFAGSLLPLATVSGEAKAQPEEYATWIIGESHKVIDAALGRGPLPDFQHAMHDLRLLWLALKAYSEAHAGALPSELADAIDFIPADALPDPTTRARARVFLSPKRERMGDVPDQPTEDWIKRNTSYVYLAGGLTWRGAIEARNGPILIHAPIDEPFDIHFAYGHRTVIPSALTFGQIFECGRSNFDEKLAESKDSLDAARRAQPAR